MTDRQIIFSGPMVKALLDGRKTQTRRILKPMPNTTSDPSGNGNWGAKNRYGYWAPVHEIRPYAPGDRLYVREAWRCNGWATDVATIFYRASEGDGYTAMCEQYPVKGKHPLQPDGKWKPSIHLPRWASRLTLTVTEVRIERLNDISDKDALAEGVEGVVPPVAGRDMSIDGDYWEGGPTRMFRTLWGMIHGPDAWDANPWVVAVTFTVEKANIDQVKP